VWRKEGERNGREEGGEKRRRGEQESRLQWWLV
jgi:hypothetical protein